MLTITNQDTPEVVLAYLNNLISCKGYEKINGEYTLKFVAVMEELKTEFLYDENNIVIINNDFFKPLIIAEERTQDNELLVTVECEHISYDLLKRKFATFAYTSTNAANVMTQALMGTDFTYAGGDVLDNSTINYTQESNSKQLTIAIANNWGGELKYFRRNVYLYEQRGQARGVDFRLGKNLGPVTRTVDRSKRDEDGNPKVSYEVNPIELRNVEGYENLEYYELGDTVRCIDELINIHVTARVVEVEYDYLYGETSKVVLGNPIPDIRGSLSGLGTKVNQALQEAQNANDTISANKPDWDVIGSITNALGQVLTAKLAGTISTAQNIITNGTSTVEFTTQGIYCHDQPTTEASTLALMLGASGLLVANSKNVFGGWVWGTGATGDGVFANHVTAAALSGLTMDTVTLTSTDIKSGSIGAVNIQGANAYFGDILSGNYMSITDSAWLQTFYSGANMLSISSNSYGQITMRTNGDSSKVNFTADMQINSESVGGIISYGKGVGVSAAPGYPVYIRNSKTQISIMGDGTIFIGALGSTKPHIYMDAHLDISGSLTVNQNAVT